MLYRNGLYHFFRYKFIFEMVLHRNHFELIPMNHNRSNLIKALFYFFDAKMKLKEAQGGNKLYCWWILLPVMLSTCILCIEHQIYTCCWVLGIKWIRDASYYDGTSLIIHALSCRHKKPLTAFITRRILKIQNCIESYIWVEKEYIIWFN